MYAKLEVDVIKYILEAAHGLWLKKKKVDGKYFFLESGEASVLCESYDVLLTSWRGSKLSSSN